MSDIILAYDGHIEKLEMLRGSSETENKGGMQKITDAESFDKILG